MYERKRLPTTDVDLLVAAEDPALAAGEDQRVGELRAAILRLPDDYRAPLVMQVLGGFTTAEIAAELQLSQPAVLTRLFRARDKLREIYGLAPRGAGAAEDAGAGAGARMMNCEEARLQIGADPAASAPQLEAHVAGCADCAGYRHEMRRLDDDLRRAMGGLPVASGDRRGRRAARFAGHRQQRGAAAVRRQPGAARRPPARAPTRIPRRCRPRGAGRWRRPCCWSACWRPRSSRCSRAMRWHRRWSRTSARSRIPGRRPSRSRARRSSWCWPARACDSTRWSRAASSMRTAASCAGGSMPHLVVSTPTGPVTVIVLRGESVPRARRVRGGALCGRAAAGAGRWRRHRGAHARRHGHGRRRPAGARMSRRRRPGCWRRCSSTARRRRRSPSRIRCHCPVHGRGEVLSEGPAQDHRQAAFTLAWRFIEQLACRPRAVYAEQFGDERQRAR